VNLFEHQALGVESADGVRAATRLLQGRHGVEVHVAPPPKLVPTSMPSV
jgi:hypothetical protein